MEEKKEKIVQRIVEEGYQISPEALEYLSSLEDQQLNTYLDKILATAKKKEDLLVITPQFVKDIFEVKKETKVSAENIPAKMEIISSPSTQISLQITKDILVNYFRDKYQKLKRILEQRYTYQTIENILQRGKPGENVKLIGMIFEKSENNDLKFVVEDETGVISVKISRKNPQLFNEARRYMSDQVIFIEGSLDENRTIEAKTLALPDIVPAHEPKKAEIDIYAAFISDLHIGHSEFQEKGFKKFVNWLKTKGKEKIKYLLVAGDLINDPKEEENYDTLYTYLKEISKSIEIIMIPGENDATLPMLPQPPITKNTEKLVEMSNVKILGNPALVKIHNASILMFHGLHMEKLAEEISAENPLELAKFLLKSRHLCPCYGSIPIIPHPGDLLAISTVPDILHLGHFHLTLHGEYQGVHIISSGTWIANRKEISETSQYCQVPIINLRTFEVKILNFTE